MIKNKSLAFKLIIFLSGSCAVILIAVFALNYKFSKKMIMQNVEENAKNLTFRKVNQIETVLSAIRQIPENIACLLESSPLNEQDLIKLLNTIVKNNDEIYGGAIAFEPYAFKKNSLYFAPYFYKEKNQLNFTMLGSDSYNYFSYDWYQIPKELNNNYWSEPYFDGGGGNALMVTYSVPFYQNNNGTRVFKGVVTADISLNWLKNIVSSIKVLQTGDAYLISKNGTIITHNIKSLIMNETIFSFAEERGDASLREIGRKMIRGEFGFVKFLSMAKGKKCWMSYAPVPLTEWTLAVIFPEDEIMADVKKLNIVFAVLGFIGVGLLTIVIILISQSITKPLREMVKMTQAIGTGNFDFDLPVAPSQDEVGKLSASFTYMKKSLKEYIAKLTETTAAKERIESELKIAHDIQTGMLPRIFPPFPLRKELDIFAMMEPAKEVGGDFYDFFFINDKKLFFVIGDVSGKGVPAALFMMITKTLLKNEALQNETADEILFRVNNIVALDNESSMFATILCGILNTDTGEIELANAGHNPPLVCRNGQGFEYLKLNKGFVLGPMQNSKYTVQKLQLLPGEKLFLYTDGVTEAMNPQKELFSETRLKQLLNDLKDKKFCELFCGLRGELKNYAKEEPQSDDITMLALKYVGKI